MRAATLQSTGDVRAVFAARQAVHGRTLSLHGRLRADDDPGRAAVVAGRRVGKAVHRNRAKRRLRAVLRHQPPPCGVDFVLVAKPPALTVPYDTLAGEYQSLRGRLLARLERIS
jgi:ribonuclease P protein component